MRCAQKFSFYRRLFNSLNSNSIYRVFVSACLLILIVLSGCADQDDEDKSVKKSPIPICPQVAIVRELSTVYDFGTESPDIAELVAEARLVSVQGECEYKKDGIDLTFDVNFRAARGPRLGGQHTSFSYFIAVVDPYEKILNKEIMTYETNFSKDSRYKDDLVSEHVFVPLSKDKRSTAPGYRILVGFQLTPEQLDAVHKMGKNKATTP